jgi:hypothetical protein
MVLERCRLYQIALNPSKCQIMVSHGVVLGHIVSRRGIATDPDKVRVIQTLEPPRTTKEVQIFMGHMNYYRRFIKGYVDMSRPIYGLMHNPEWTQECEIAFQQLKRGLSTAPILKGSNWEKEFHVHTDASAYAIGCVLTQPGESKLDYPVYFASRQLDATERNYTTTEREGLAMVFSCKKFRHYLLANHFKFYIDHQALLYLVNMPCTTGRITRWLLLL